MNKPLSTLPSTFSAPASRKSLKSALLLGAVSAMGLAVHTQAGAQEVGRVISTTAIISQVSVPRQTCAQEVVQVQTQTPATKSGAGAIMGGIAGGAMGNAIGNGTGRAAATVLGIFGGAILGDRIEGGSPAQVATTQQTVNRCSTQNYLENRTTGYQVVYEYAGKQYSVQMPQDPGPTIQLQVAPVAPTLPAAPAQPLPRVMSQVEPQVIESQPVTTVISSGTVYQPYVVPAVTYASPVVVGAPYYYYPRPVVGASFVFGGGHWRGGHGHHRYVR
jgi:uncharacterized protein YcfJ